jgi:hypothetical protein
MRKRILRRKPFVVDREPYEASVSATFDKVFQLGVTIRADFGNRSYCLIRGLRNFGYWYNYGYWNKDYSESEDTISITPRMIAALIRFARRNGWSPEESKSNHSVTMTNPEAKSALEEFKASECHSAFG